MMLEEANARLKSVKINEEQLWGLNSLYIVLDLHKDDFCKIVDAVGLEVLLAKQAHYERLEKADGELYLKEQYLRSKARLAELEDEREVLERIVKGYKPLVL
ncbi:hypothetical protein [Sinanaerobacter chloroacetimidivorans]|uniref:Uncharacterized protein n=1 Tax=Sinanaerobacter chloroacetimidivorans TaxID=2818044 RepID=A0A8J7VX21_9FIRM|nr:hypothetical protein [Sinanaerobacter chloroacetimidivorans]MBR0596607.1 hypothetical protein [Sinanaerobacter chloroacetimidivorans]